MQKSDRTAIQKNKIIEHARSLFWMNGYDNTTMQDIASACKFEASNVYNYFHSKEHLLFDVLQEGSQTLIALTQDLENDTRHAPVERLRMLIYRNVKHVLGYRRASGLLFDVGLKDLSATHRKEIIKLRDQYESIVRNIIRDGISDGSFVQIDERQVSFAIISIIARTRIWFSSKGSLSYDDISEFIFQFSVNGITTKNKSV